MSVQVSRSQVPGLPDFEIQDLPRTRPLTYTLTLPEGCSAGAPAKGLVVYIPGFGEDNHADYVAKLCGHIAEKHGHACVAVDYHACRSRPAQGCAINLERDGLLKLQLLCLRHDVALDESDLMRTLHLVAEKLPEPTALRAVLEPTDGEYQNFGVLQALDHLVVINHLVAERIPCEWQNVILIGSSHGGYIAHLVAKFAPNTVNAIIDNSSYVRAPWSFLSVFPECHFGPAKLRIDCSVLSRWQFRAPSEPGYYGIAQQLIRDVSCPPHLQEMKRQSERLPRYFCFNSVADPYISPIEHKRFQQQQLQGIGAECRLEEITAAKLDGVLWKTLAHGMNASMKTLCDRVLSQIVTRPTTVDCLRGTALTFDGFDQSYRIEHLTAGPWMRASVRPT
jgi:hypothetical protein